MKKTVAILLAIIMIVTLSACSKSKEKEKSVFDKMKDSSVALMESSDGVKVYVWNMQDLASLSSLQIEEAPLEPADSEKDWLYRITYNPKEKVSNSEEIILSFHSDYIQIGSEYYLAKQGVDFNDILEWAESKFTYLVKEYGAEDDSGAANHPTGFDGEMLYINVDGETLAYERYKPGIGSLTADTVLDMFDQETEIEGIVWEIYSTEEYPDLSYVLVISGTNAEWTYVKSKFV